MPHSHDTRPRAAAATAAAANSLLIVVWSVWGWLSNSWYVETLGGNPGPHEVVKWLLILINAPSFLASVALIAPFHLDLRIEYAASSALWIALSLPTWFFYRRLIGPTSTLVRMLSAITATLALLISLWAFSVAWREGHDPAHSCWSVMALVVTFLGIAAVALAPLVASRRAGGAGANAM